MKFVVEGVDITENPYTFTPTANTTVTAQFEVVTPPTPEYTVTVEVNPAGAGTVTGAGTVAEGESVTLTATANEGYNFVKFVVEGTDITDNPYTFTPEADVTVIAQFDAQTLFDITIAETENGTITAPANAAAGETVTVTTTPDEGYVLVTLFYYTTDPTEVTNIDLATLSFEMPEADITIGATFVSTDNKGDVNGDGNINIIDVLATLNYILEKDPQPFIFEQADMNEDGIIDIKDVTVRSGGLIASTGSEVFDLNGKLRIEDALNATKAAVEEGIVAGGGTALINAMPPVKKLTDSLSGDEKTGAQIVLRALEEPVRQIAANAGLEGSVIIDKIVRSKKTGYGFDAYNETYVDMIPAGIVDPTKVTRSALQNAASVASMVLTTESLVADIKEDAPAAPAMPAGGMY